jgi:mRNA-degrading endonuclease toxin of MazEF toxin-antitoxin module
VVTEIFRFDRGEAAAQDHLDQVPAVVAALSRAIKTRTDIWVPFPMPDLGREQHIRRLCLVLQRRGLNLLLGRELVPCSRTGGFNAVDYALRTEVQAVDGLDRAVLAAAGMRTLGDEIELALIAASEDTREPAASTPQAPHLDHSEVGEKYYSTGEVAKIFGKSVQWVYWGMRDKVFTYPDGSVIEPIRLGKGGRRRFTIAVVREMARSCYRRGTLSEARLKDILAELAGAEER